MGVQHHVVDHAQTTTEDGVGLALGTGSSLLHFEPAAFAGFVAQIGFLVRGHQQHIVLLGTDSDRHQAGGLRIASLHHAGLVDGTFHQGAGHGVGSGHGSLAGGRAAEHQVTTVRGAQRVASVAGVVEIFIEVLVDTAGAGEVDEFQLIHVLGPVFGQTVLGHGTQIVLGALAGHATASGYGVAQLVDDHFIGEELELFFFTLDATIAGGGLATELDGKVEGDPVASSGFDISLALNDAVVASPFELGEVGLLVRLIEEAARPDLDCFGVTKADYSLTHSACPRTCGLSLTARHAQHFQTL